MALILCIETATCVCSVALAQDGNCIAKYEHPQVNAHAAELHVMVEKIIQESGFSFNDLSAIAISKGPGSYTGLRVGVSAAKGYAYALNKPIIAINTLVSLTVMAQKIMADPNALFIPMIDARRMEVYTAVLDAKLQFLEETTALVVEENAFQNFKETGEVYFFGNGAEKCRGILENPHTHFLPNITCSAAGLTQMAHAQFLKKEFENLAYFEPYYLKDFIGTQAKNKFF